jgi:hypothetical protein
MPQVFREIPPLELVEEVFRTFTLAGLDDTNWFSKISLNMQELEVLLPQIEPYYIPCKAKEFLHPKLTPIRGITILRHLCKIHSIHLTASERTCAGVKGTWYQIAPTRAKAITIDFT